MGVRLPPPHQILMRTPHTSCRKGKRVIVTLKDGSRFIDKFLEQTGKFNLFENHRVKTSEILSFGIFKGEFKKRV